MNDEDNRVSVTLTSHVALRSAVGVSPHTACWDTSINLDLCPSGVGVWVINLNETHSVKAQDVIVKASATQL